MSPESGQFCFQCADRKEGARGPTVEHHLYVSSDVTRTWGTVIRGGLRADVESPAMWVDWISQKQDKETNITERLRARLG